MIFIAGKKKNLSKMKTCQEKKSQVAVIKTLGMILICLVRNWMMMMKLLVKKTRKITITVSAAMITKTWKKTKNSRSGRWDFYNLFLAVKNIPMKNDLIYLVLALVTGALIPIQASTNSIFSKSIGNPLITGLMVFIVGLVGMIIFIVL